MKLWQKNYELDKEVEKFTVGNDYLTDRNLVRYDAYGSIAHSMMLNRIGILSKRELKKLKTALKEIIKLDQNSKFEIKQQDEDVHTAIENHLTKKLGNLGKKIHTARSRNDQVLADLRLYSKAKLLETQKHVVELASALSDSAKKYKYIPMPGYTHSRKAMPSSIGLYFGSFAESLVDDLEVLDEAYELNNQSPLGSGAGYGLPLDVDRQFTSDLLGFEKVQNNSLYVQNSRGKFESVAIFALGNLMADLARLSNDLVMFSMEEFGFFTLPDEFCTGSSIMPQKKNPDVFELMRAKAAKVDANLYFVKSAAFKMQSGYNRDLQLTKDALIESFDIALSALKIFTTMIGKIKINTEKCIEACTPDLFATEHAYDLVKKGMPFRDAYAEAAKNMGRLKKIDPVKNIQSKKHLGATGNLGLDKLSRTIMSANREIDAEISSFSSKLEKLVK